MTPTQSRSRCDNLGFEMDDTNEPGEFLRPRRNEVTAAAAGIPIGGDRSRPGLRREEVALRAGLSTDYFTRLERGPESDPSEQVVNAVSRPLQLDRRHAAEYFFRLTQPAPRATSTPVSAASDQFGAVFRTWIPHTGNGSRTPAGPVGRHLAGPGVVRPIRAVRQPVAHDLLRSRRPRVLRRLGPRRTWCGEQCAGPSAPYRCAPKVVAVVGEPTGRSPAYVTYWQRREVRPRVNEAKALRHRALSPAMGCWGPFTAYKPSKRSIPSASITAGCRSGCIGSLNPARSTVRCDSSETDRVVGDVRTSLTPRT